MKRLSTDILQGFNGWSTRVSTDDQPDSQRMIQQSLNGWSHRVSTDDQSKFQRMNKFKRAINSDLTVTYVDCMQMECGSLFTGFREQRSISISMLNWRYSKMLDWEMKKHEIRLETLSLICLSLYHVTWWYIKQV